MLMELRYHNPTSGVRILGTTNESEIEIDRWEPIGEQPIGKMPVFLRLNLQKVMITWMWCIGICHYHYSPILQIIPVMGY